MTQITKMIIIHSQNILPSDIAMKIYESKADVMVKETCFGVLITGEQEAVDNLVREIRNLDPYGIFVKERGILPGNPYRCRANRGGGARPGFHQMEHEDSLLPWIGAGLRSLEAGEVPRPRAARRKLDVEKLREIAIYGM